LFQNWNNAGLLGFLMIFLTYFLAFYAKKPAQAAMLFDSDF
jgi:hypothetical protein